MARREEDEEDLENLLNKGALWAVTYGDLMSYLMIFFLIMFTFAIKGKSAMEGLQALQTHFGGKLENVQMQKFQLKKEEDVVAEELRKKFKTYVSEEKIQITLDEKILFDTGKADLKKEVYPALKLFAEQVKNIPNIIMVEGHTDNVPVRGKKYKSNFELSMARAYAVMKHLIDVEKLNPQRMSGAGYGEYRPVVPNDSAEHKAQNRRIELSFIRTQ